MKNGKSHHDDVNNDTTKLIVDVSGYKAYPDAPMISDHMSIEEDGVDNIGLFHYGELHNKKDWKIVVDSGEEYSYEDIFINDPEKFIKYTNTFAILQDIPSNRIKIFTQE